MTPLAPTDWSMIFDGESVSLRPSVGNWYLACRSHYIIRNGRVIEAPSWSEDRIENEWRRDRKAKATYYGSGATEPGNLPTSSVAAVVEQAPKRRWWSQFWKS